MFTKKHNLTLKSDALALLCSFIGRRCGADWRDSGAGEKLLDEIARQWKRNEGTSGILVDGGEALKSVLRGLEVPGGGAAGGGDLLRRENSFDLGAGVPSSALYDGEIEAHMGAVAMQDLGGEEGLDGVDPKKFLKIVDAFSQPKYNYNVLKRGFEKYLPDIFCGGYSLTLDIELQSPHSSHQHQQKPTSSAPATPSSISVSSVQNSSSPQPSLPPP